MMKNKDRKKLIQEYKDTPRPAGVYRVLNIATGKSLVGSSPDVPAILNRQRFQLEHGSHPDKELQADWNELGPSSFEFQELDRLEPKSDPADNPAEDLTILKEIWLDKLKAAGEPLYPQSWRSA